MGSDAYKVHPIGSVWVDEPQGFYRLIIDEAFRPALHKLGCCSHAIVLWWADRISEEQGSSEDLIVELPYAPGVRTGVFANRSQSRPNPIAITPSYLLGVDEGAGIVDLAWIDAYNGTPVLDIKPYLPMSDLILEASYPEWLEGYPASMEEAAAFFSDPENAAKFS